MIRPIAAVAAATFMTLSPRSAEADTIRLQAFDAELRPTRAASWDPRGKILGTLSALPGGELAGAVENASGSFRIVRWDSDGKELASLEPRIAGKVLAFRVRRDGSYLVVTGHEVAAVAAGDGRVLARRAAPAGAASARQVEAGESGAWFAFVESGEDDPERGRVVHAPLEGPDVVRPLPVTAPPLEQCRKEYGDRACPWAASNAKLLPLASGGCLVAERLRFRHDAGGPNVTEQVVLTTIDRAGALVGQRTFGDVERSLEWFRFDSSAGNSTMFPGKFHLVRRRYDGTTWLALASERADGDVLAVLVSGVADLVRLAPSLERRWSQTVQASGGAALSPPWTRGVFLYSGISFLHAFDDGGGAVREASLTVKGYDPGSLRNLVGQTAAGEWLLVSY